LEANSFKAGLYVLAVAAAGFLLLSTNIASVGPCTDEFGAACFLAVFLCTPAGVVLLAIGGIQAWLRSRKAQPPQQTAQT
jgi:uncharacterized RDD family membrane protein YckC